ncbi:uncharacterized protein EAF02_005737 [Botrytis sinoallii]|uniref:uncharacterized protein n=1 Tax=Botrytis sinoallii TaxID=1463999 RepID=UPI001901A80B|nr:uncharacterized protein EAF02_005737 [Botrytis sinoallii]KAF7882374.1 hypothetical protein EAF02_005737 [Botrytis sinoallii]
MSVEDESPAEKAPKYLDDNKKRERTEPGSSAQSRCLKLSPNTNEEADPGPALRAPPAKYKSTPEPSSNVSNQLYRTKTSK